MSEFFRAKTKVETSAEQATQGRQKVSDDCSLKSGILATGGSSKTLIKSMASPSILHLQSAGLYRPRATLGFQAKKRSVSTLNLHMSEQQKPKRVRERLELKLPVRVRCRETADFEWTEITRLIDVTPFGAGFTLKRPVEKGRLLQMTIPMPRQLRVFDHVEDQYRVWALVRRIKLIESPGSTSSLFEVGVAFIGKRAPRSYDEDPSRRYESEGDTPDSLAVIEELPVESASSDNRTQTRHSIPVDMLIETLDDKGAVVDREQTVTENISNKGAAMYTTLNLTTGRFIRLTSEQYKLTVYAAVRGHSVGALGVPRIHVEFIDREWPL